MSSPGMSAALPEELRDLCEQLQNITEDAVELTTPLNDTQFNWHPEPGRWSIAECLAHLNASDGLALPMLSGEIERAHRAGITGKGPFHYGYLSRLLIRYTEPPVRLKGKAPRFIAHRRNSPRKRWLRSFSPFTTGCWTWRRNGMAWT